MTARLIVNGAAGRMGRRIIALAWQDPDIQIVAALDRQGHPDAGKDAGVLAGIEPLGIELSSQVPVHADVMIDFSLPDAADATISHCLENGIALVIGTTGLTGVQFSRIDAASRRIPIVQATNMSVGMNILFSMVGRIAEMAGDDYDIEITEAHHRFKKDSPSGSALTLAENIARETGREYPGCLTHGRHGPETLRQKGKIGMHAIRGGDIVGQHSVMYSTIGETVTISHNAHSRDTFASGAIRAAKWVVGKSPARYSMRDVLGL
jgi:4-hydroxy-tetrahydrodipicolinate reductase